ncbi:MAG: DUF368 domain-containing protein [Bacteroidales bacterium]
MAKNKTTNIFKYLFVALKGLCMGAADVIPGVSGGTIAFLTGIYEELVDSIRLIDARALKYLFSLKISKFWKHINGWFLISVFLGVLISVFSLAKLMIFLMNYYPIQLWSFFFGLIISSSIFILRNVNLKKTTNILALVFGIALGAVICLLSPGETTNEIWFIFLSGGLAVCAMILPGISGSFILLLLGKYPYIMSAVSDFKIEILLVFGLGAIIGLLMFSRVLSWLLKRFYSITVVALAGIMLGSLLKLWPWQNILSSGVSRPSMPDGNIKEAIFFCTLGIILVYFIEFIAKFIKKYK